MRIFQSEQTCSHTFIASRATYDIPCKKSITATHIRFRSHNQTSRPIPIIILLMEFFILQPFQKAQYNISNIVMHEILVIYERANLTKNLTPKNICRNSKQKL
jgi:hypothetical protein